MRLCVYGCQPIVIPVLFSKKRLFVIITLAYGKKGDFFVVKELFDNHIFIYIMCGLFGVGVLIKFILSLIYASLVRASENMGSAKNKLTQLMKLKFETFYKLKIGVNNVDIFVDKYVYHHKFGGILLSTWESISGQVLMLCLLIGSVSSILGLIYECGKTQILSVFSVGIITSGLLIVFEGVLNLSGKKELIRVNMRDYLENFLKVRLEQQLFSPDMLEHYKKEYLDKENSENIVPDSADESAKEHFIMVEKTESGDKPLTKKDKRIAKKERKALARMEAAQLKEAVKLEKRQKKEDRKARKLQLKLEKKQNKINKKEAEIARRLEEKRMKERKKEEARLALEHKRAQERAEIERKKEELRKAEERRREEKIRQKEIKKALLLEKRMAKSDKKKSGVEQKTIAQERKENLMKEIQERRELENYTRLKETEEIHKDEQLSEEPSVEFSNQTNEIPTLKLKYENIPAEEPVKQVEKAVPQVDALHKEENKGKNPQVRSINTKKKKNINQLEDKLIEDILKEFLA